MRQLGVVLMADDGLLLFDGCAGSVDFCNRATKEERLEQMHIRNTLTTCITLALFSLFGGCSHPGEESVSDETLDCTSAVSSIISGESTDSECTGTASSTIFQTITIPPGGLIICDDTSCHGACGEGSACGFSSQFGRQPFNLYQNKTLKNQECIKEGTLCGKNQCRGPKPSWATSIGTLFVPCQS
jgi:hypothetical protein